MAGRTAGAVGMCGLQFHDGAKVNIYQKSHKQCFELLNFRTFTT